MLIKIVTALFDIGREKYDGRTIDDYLRWFSKTLALECDMVVYTQIEFVNFVKEYRKDKSTEIIVQKLEDVPFYKYYDKIERILSSQLFRQRMADTNRIECNLPSYNIIQYSKFGWLKDAASRHPETEYFMWMDAGCSRFFEGLDASQTWPQVDPPSDKLTIQGNVNFNKFYPNLIPQDYCWNNECILVGTLFGGGRDIIFRLERDIEFIFNELLQNGCVNNEQFALAILAKRNPELCNIYIKLDGTHLPLFKMLGFRPEKDS